jgi:hypothetical protein
MIELNYRPEQRMVDEGIHRFPREGTSVERDHPQIHKVPFLLKAKGKIRTLSGWFETGCYKLSRRLPGL